MTKIPQSPGSKSRYVSGSGLVASTIRARNSAAEVIGHPQPPRIAQPTPAKIQPGPAAAVQGAAAKASAAAPRGPRLQQPAQSAPEARGTFRPLATLQRELEALRSEELRVSKEIREFVLNAELLSFPDKFASDNIEIGSKNLETLQKQILAKQAEIAVEQNATKAYALGLVERGDQEALRGAAGKRPSAREHGSAESAPRLRALRDELQILHEQAQEIDAGLQALLEAPEETRAQAQDLILADTEALAGKRAEIAAKEAEIGKYERGQVK